MLFVPYFLFIVYRLDDEDGHTLVSLLYFVVKSTSHKTRRFNDFKIYSVVPRALFTVWFVIRQKSLYPLGGHPQLLAVCR